MVNENKKIKKRKKSRIIGPRSGLILGLVSSSLHAAAASIVGEGGIPPEGSQCAAASCALPWSACHSYVRSIALEPDPLLLCGIRLAGAGIHPCHHAPASLPRPLLHLQLDPIEGEGGDVDLSDATMDPPPAIMDSSAPAVATTGARGH